MVKIIVGFICAVLVIGASFLFCVDPTPVISELDPNKVTLTMDPIAKKNPTTNLGIKTQEPVFVNIVISYPILVDSLIIDFGEGAATRQKIDTTTKSPIFRTISKTYLQTGKKIIAAQILLKDNKGKREAVDSVVIGKAPQLLNNKHLLIPLKPPVLDSVYYLEASAVEFDTTMYTWFKNGAVTASKRVKKIVFEKLSKTDEGVYNCVVSNGFGYDTSSLCTLALSSPTKPVILNHPQSIQVVVGNSAKFVCIATPDNVKYQWLRNGQPVVTNGTSNTYEIAAATLQDNGAVLKCKVSNSETTIESQEATLTVVNAEQKPTIVKQPENLTVLRGEKARFTVEAAGTNLVYQWYKDGLDITGAILSSYEISATTEADNGKKFKCKVSNSLGSEISNEVTLTVTIDSVSKPQITKQPSDIEVTAGSEAVFSVEASGKQLQYQWKKNNTAITGAIGATYKFIAVASDSGALFKCVITNNAGFIESNEALLKVVKMVEPITIIKQPENKTVKKGDPATFTVVVTGTDPLYQWQKNGVDIPAATLNAFSLAAADTADNNLSFQC
ncbi:MAG: immunoglobulin domain-containing protein, partial [Chitinivibrionales bacterium]|nr:immunoglobulin domain-containing protein [Chitinivibrionales bacterium]